MSKLKIQRPEEKVRVRRRNALTLFVVLLLLSPFIFGGAWLWFQINTFGSPGEKVSIEIAKGSGVSEIGETLEKNGVVKSGRGFAIYTKLNRRGPYQAGQYEINKNLDAGQAASVLEKGPKINYDKFTIIPGQRLIDVQKNVGKLPGLSSEKFNQAASSGIYKSKFMPPESTNLEGFLLPETYQISSSENEEDIIRRSLEEFEARAQTNGLNGDANGYSAYQIVTIASLIEKEARYEDDRALISSVIYNRLKMDMLLQIDATVLYGLGRSGGSLSKSDLAKDTPFNTYTRKGLVPTPISMISMSSLRAALEPAESDYLFYVLIDAKTGKHAFSKTYEEHLNNIEIAKQNGAL